MRVQPLLVLALELVIQGDALDACPAFRELLRLAQVRPIDLRIVLDFARLDEARIELLPRLLRVGQAMRVQQVPAAIREHDDGFAVALDPLGAHESLLPQVPEVTGSRMGRASVVIT